ncbi:PAS domain S-box protein [Haloterrigena alkaliphila]|uniref:histidine kinase n=1 Tax=Haloterrigena alkaliphila TaxID=2816475 RepID=A0A8A2VCV5_9EURY|nr:PAS domain S-box protein [Haloterrigena alkaliphila]QSW98055.1 PAS domain S-box protein [Haloterrigena alkaliphila]
MSDRPASAVTTFWGAGDDRTALQCSRALVDCVDGGIVRLDADDRFLAVDDALLETTGYARDDLLGSHVSVLLPERAVKRLERARSGSDGETVVAVETAIRSADGATVPCEFRSAAVRLDDGSRGSVGVVREREASTAAPFEPVPTILEEADVGVFVLDEEFEVAWINEASERYFGIDRADVVGRDKRELVTGTIGERMADTASFSKTLLEAYDADGAVEQFECRVTPDDDREERWLEHRSRPVESGPYAGGRIELYYDVTEQRRRATQLRRLNEAVQEWLEGTTREYVAERACHHLVEILGLEINGVFLHDPDADVLRPTAWSAPADALFGELPTFAAGEGIAWRVFDTGEPETYSDVTADPDVYNADTPVRSEICLPIGDHGVVIIGSEARNAFDDGDRSLAKIVASSLEATFDRLRHERHLERERAQTEKLLRTAPVAISVEDADGETMLSNRRARETLGVTDRVTIGDATAIDGWTVSDADGDPLDPERTPAAQVRETGEAVFDRELVLTGPDGERRWFSVNAAPVFGADGGLERVISVGEDVTELKTQKRRLERRKSELETELSEILGRISDGFYALDDEFRFTHVNETAEELLGRSREDLLGTVVWDVFPDAVESDLDERYREALETQEPISFERRSEPLGIWAQVQVYPSETGLSIYFRDISERKARERELRTYETIVETIEDGIYELDADGRFTTVNDAYVALTGYDREELIGAHASLVVDESVMNLAREVAADESDVPTVETELETTSGERIPVEATVTSVGDGPERVGVVRDVTEREERQRRLEESEQRYRTLAENFPNGIVALYDEDLRYTAAGGQLVGELGIDREAAIGQTIHERYSDDLLAEIEPHFRATLEGEERSFDVRYRDRELLARTLPVRTGGDGRTGMLVVQDVTERAEYQRKLEESNERLEQFAYAASHDLQEPLRMVTSYLQLLENRYGDELDDDGREFIAFAVDGAERMREMIDGLLEYSRVETRGDPFEPVELDAVLDDVLADLQLQIEESDADISVPSLPRVRGDRSQLRQVFQNLLSNAIEYSGDEPPRVDVSAERCEARSASERSGETAENGGSQWTVSVRDEGIGIDPDDADRVFEVFQRLHSHEEHAGTGIGLALCRRIVERHGGEISVESEPGEGSTFSVTLPALEAAE